MARIRTIKPDAFTSESLSGVSVAARWTFAGLWTYADDAGRARDDLRLIKAAVFVLDDAVSLAVLSGYLEELEKIGGICRYEAGGRRYLHMPKWHHQRINRPTPSVLPPCPYEHSVSDPGPITDDSVKPHAPLTEPSRGEGKGRERKGRDGARARAHQLPDTWQPTQRHRDKALELELILTDQVEAFRDHFKATGKKYTDWNSAFSGWMRRSAAWADGGPKPPVRETRKHPPMSVPDHIDPDDTEAYAAWMREAAQ